MIRIVCFALGLCVLCSVGALSQEGPGGTGVNWPSFRGPHGSGVAEGFRMPTTWSVPENQGVAWKTPVAGLGHSSPTIWGDRVCVTTAIGGNEDTAFRKLTDADKAKDAPRVQTTMDGSYPAAAVIPITDPKPLEWQVICLDKRSGKVVWQQTAHAGVPAIGRHEKSTQANATLATDGTHLVAFFGSEGLYCYQLSDGRLLWKKSFGVLDSGYWEVPSWQWGFASSPVIHDGRLILLADVQKDSFLASLDVTTGKEVWRTPRRDVPTFGTPTVVRDGNRTQIAVNGWRQTAGYDFATGAQLWSLNNPKGGDLPVPTPIVDGGLMFFTSGHVATRPIIAVRTSARGALTLEGDAGTNPHIAWNIPRDGSYVPTPVIYRGLLYNGRDVGALEVYEAATGKRLYQQRLGPGGRYTSSPVAGDGKVYFTSEDGDVFVVKAGPVFELLAQNEMGKACMATPAISEGRLYFRTRSHLVAIR